MHDTINNLLEVVRMDQCTESAAGIIGSETKSTKKPTYEELNQYLYTVNRQLNGMKKVVKAKETELQLLNEELQSLKKIPNTIAFQLGKTLLAAKKSPKAMLFLPVDLMRLVRKGRARKGRKANKACTAPANPPTSA